jgi:hypothetical protein
MMVEDRAGLRRMRWCPSLRLPAVHARSIVRVAPRYRPLRTHQPSGNGMAEANTPSGSK